MGKVGYSGVANQANTSDGFALGIGAQNVIGGTDFGLDVGDDGVVDVYGATPETTFYILDETSPGYVLQENDDKIVLEAS
jgi:uncharacterized protein (DUF2342 family)